MGTLPRGNDFGIIDAFYQGLKDRPDSTFGTFNDDVLAFKDPNFRRIDICNIILRQTGGADLTAASKWPKIALTKTGIRRPY